MMYFLYMMHFEYIKLKCFIIVNKIMIYAIFLN